MIVRYYWMDKVLQHQYPNPPVSTHRKCFYKFWYSLYSLSQPVQGPMLFFLKRLHYHQQIRINCWRTATGLLHLHLLQSVSRHHFHFYKCAHIPSQNLLLWQLYCHLKINWYSFLIVQSQTFEFLVHLCLLLSVPRHLMCFYKCAHGLNLNYYHHYLAHL